jgi:hypothetical protein
MIISLEDLWHCRYTKDQKDAGPFGKAPELCHWSIVGRIVMIV